MKWFGFSLLSVLLVAGLAQARADPARTLARQAMTAEQGLCGRARITCGQLMRPIDPSGAIQGSLSIAYARYTHWGPGSAKGTIVAQEGGPGLSSLGSFSSYSALYAPLLRDHDLVVVDARGTGHSGAIDCLPLQNARLPTSENVGACGHTLGEVADYYATGLAVEDVIAVLDKLGVRKFDYYGDSYGTFFGQTLAARYPQRLRSMVLDGGPIRLSAKAPGTPMRARRCGPASIWHANVRRIAPPCQAHPSVVLPSCCKSSATVPSMGTLRMRTASLAA